MNFSLQQQWLNMQQRGYQVWETKLAPRYDALEEREQRVVRIAAIFLPIIIVVFGVFLPILDKNKALQDQIATLSIQVQEANQLADRLAANPQSAGGNNDTNMLTRVDRLARQTGVRTFMTRLRPQQVMGGEQRLQTQIKDAPYAKIADFLVTLEKNNLPVSQLKIQSAKDGYVHVQAMIGG